MKERPILFSAPMVRAILDGTKTQTRRVVKPQPPKECTHAGPVMGTYSGIAVPRFYWQTAEDFDQAEKEDKDLLFWPAADDEESDEFTADIYGLGGMECPYGSEANCLKAADRLWVKEGVFQHNNFGFPLGSSTPIEQTMFNGNGERVWSYAADGITEKKTGTRSSRCMPRWASRITLEVTGVRVERLQDISEADAKREGVQREDFGWVDYLMPSTQITLTAAQSYRTLWESINGPDSWTANPWVWVVEFRRVHP
ncbi:hypothetical protein IP84_16850 [beta proteobacterium AAP99]|nr:hypothetical protein IP84_16850 [beta proteobacterium AAP99]